MNKIIHTTLLAALVGTGSIFAGGMVGCAASDEPETAYLATPPELQPRPDLESVPDEAVRVAVMSGTGDFAYTVEENQRWYLVDETGDRLLASDVAEERGELSVGQNGAELNGDTVWEGNTANVDSLALYLARRAEKP